MKARIIKKMISELPNPNTYPNDYIVISYFPATTKNLRLINLEKPVGGPIPTVEIHFRKVYDENGMDWEFVDINVLKID
jgi:hypothetical protein